MDNRAQKGLILKQARESKGIALETIHEATKIPLDALKAIEEGYRVRTMTDFYYRAFIKLYAKYLEIEITTVLEDYKPEELPEPTSFHKGRTFWEDEKLPMLSPDVVRNIVRVVVVVFGIFIIVRIGGCIFNRKPNDSSKRIEKAREVKKSKKKIVRTVALKPAVKKEEAKQQNVQADLEKKVNLVVRAKKRIWLRVSTDGSEVFRSSLSKGAVESWSAKEKIELSGKNLNGLDLELNGKVISSLSSGVRRAQKIIITPNGFTVEE